jgi:hypothetical protein
VFHPELTRHRKRHDNNCVRVGIQCFECVHCIRIHLQYSSHHLLRTLQMWSFGLVPEIARIFKQSDYPKHLPNTVVPTYSAAMHAKYEVLQWAIKQNPFKTRYFCWLDVGLFRDLSKLRSVNRFSLYLPPYFNTGSVAYQEVYGARNTKATVKDIVYNNMVWVCGCFFIGEAGVMYQWTLEYKVSRT